MVTGGGAAQDGLGAGGLAFTPTLCASPSRGPGLGAGGEPGSGALGPTPVVLESGFARPPSHGPAPGPWAAGPCPPFSRVLWRTGVCGTASPERRGRAAGAGRARTVLQHWPGARRPAPRPAPRAVALREGSTRPRAPTAQSEPVPQGRCGGLQCPAHPRAPCRLGPGPSSCREPCTGRHRHLRQPGRFWAPGPRGFAQAAPRWPGRCLPCPSHPAALTGSALGSEVTGFRERGDRGQGAGCGGHAVPFQGKPADGVGEERAGAAKGPRGLGGWCEQQGPWQREPVSQGRVGHRGAPCLPCCHVGPSVRAFRGRCLCPNGAEPWGAQHSHGAGAQTLAGAFRALIPSATGEAAPPLRPLPRETRLGSSFLLPGAVA